MSRAVREIKSLTNVKRDRKYLTTLWGSSEGQGSVV